MDRVQPRPFNFNHHEPKAATAKVRRNRECAFCHIASAEKDEVWTQFYRLTGQVSRDAANDVTEKES